MVGRTLAGSLGLVGDFDLGENGWKDDMDNNLLWLSVLTQGRVIDVLADVLATPAQGDVIILASGHATYPNRIAAYDEGAWKYRAPLAGWRLFNTALGVFLQFSGTAWVADTAALDAEAVRDVISAALVSGTNVTVVPNDAADTITFNSSAATTAEEIQDAVAAALVQGSNVTITYDDTGNTITVAAAGGALDLEAVRDAVAAFLVQGANITIVHDDAADTLTISGAAGGGGGGGSGGISAVIDDATVARTLVIGDASAYIRRNNAAANTVTVPPEADVAFPIKTQIFVEQRGAGQTSIVAGAGVTILTPETLKLRKLYSALVLTKVAADVWIVTGDLELASLSAANTFYRISWFFTRAMDASEVILIHPFTKAATFPANWAGSVAAVDGVMPGATLVIDVQKNNASVGTISVSTAGVVTFASLGGAAVQFAVGDRLKLVGPATANTASNMSGTFEGII